MPAARILLLILLMAAAPARAEDIQVYRHMPSIQVYRDCEKKGDPCADMDMEKSRQLAAANAEWNAQMQKLAGDSDDAYFAAKEGAGDYARAWLLAYAREDGLLERVDEDVRSNRNENEFAQVCWGMNNIAMAYLKTRPRYSFFERMKIEHWMTQVAMKVAYSRYSFDARDYSKTLNNHYYSRAMVLMAVGAASGNSRMITDGKFVIAKAMADLRSDGLWPLELARQSKALHYQSFALSIVKTAVFAGSLSDPPWAESVLADPRMKTAERAAVRLFADTAFHQEVTGGFEPDRAHSKGRCGSWAYPYIQLSRDEALRSAAPAEMRWFYEGCHYNYLIGGDPDLMRDRFYRVR